MRIFAALLLFLLVAPAGCGGRLAVGPTLGADGSVGVEGSLAFGTPLGGAEVGRTTEGSTRIMGWADLPLTPVTAGARLGVVDGSFAGGAAATWRTPVGDASEALVFAGVELSAIAILDGTPYLRLAGLLERYGMPEWR